MLRRVRARHGERHTSCYLLQLRNADVLREEPDRIYETTEREARWRSGKETEVEIRVFIKCEQDKSWVNYI